MAKQTSTYTCGQCGYESPGWLGKCPSCMQWNTFVEEVIEDKPVSNYARSGSPKPVSIAKIETSNEERYLTGMSEMDRVLGGGLVKGSLVLIGGDPGIGKSTLILQICNLIKTGDSKILYVSGEESAKQIKLRADRLSINNPSILMLPETSFKSIQEAIHEEKPSIVIIDSIQTIYDENISSVPGSVSQVREVTAGLMGIAKPSNISIIIVGHVTKEGSIAGPRVLEHMVDTVLYFEGERHQSFRILRSVKNRFGSTNEIGIFEMRDSGLVEIENPSLTMLSGRPEKVPGSVVVSSMEGTRPMLIEMQALVCPTGFGMPRRTSTGIDYNRMSLLIAVLEKRVGLQLSSFDAYVNVAGGIKIDEPASDLGVIAAIASSFKNIAVEQDSVVIGEVGLTGEVRAVSHIEKRVMEAARIGFKRCVIPKGNLSSLNQSNLHKKIEIVAVDSVHAALNVLF